MLALRSRILHYTRVSPLQYEYLEDGVLLVEDGKVQDLQPASSLAAAGFDLTRCEHLPDNLIIPGLIDTHIHSPQIDVIASYGKQLLDWLNDYAFPAEAMLADEVYAKAVAEDFIAQLLRNGTTTAMVFTTSHEHAAEAVFDSAYRRDMRLIAGKVLMDRNAPQNLMDTATRGYTESARLIRRWHGKGRLGYALTPRFSGTSTDAQLHSVNQLHREFPDTWIQTHLSENLQEVAWLREICPEARDYLDTYERFGINDDRTIFAHGIHLSNDELKRLADGGGRIAFCPSSNLFLGSGLLDLQKLKDHGIPVSVASDVGGGTSFSLFRTLSDAYKVCQLQGYSLDPHEAICMATLANAEVLKLDGKIGNLAKNKEADFIVLDTGATDLISRRVAQAKNVAAELFVYITLGDERLVSRTYVNGVVQFERPGI